MEFTYNQLILYGFIAGLIIGLILGLILLYLGIKKGKRKLGIIGLICSIVGGAISGILSIIIAIVFIWLILRKPGENKPIESEAVSENSIDEVVKDSEKSSDTPVSDA